jgi:predicted esterase
MGSAYVDRDIGHLYEYVPPHVEGERLPALVFLHGSAGNFKAYFHLWRAVADRARVILLCPSFGFGNWNQPGGMEAIDRAVRHAIDTLHADPNKVILAGLSNGGRGVTRAMSLHPERYAGILFVSAVMEADILAAWPEQPGGFLRHEVLVIHGDVDRRIPIEHANHAVEVMRTRDANVTYRVVEGEDHFLLFARAGRVQTEVAAWVRGVVGQR